MNALATIGGLHGPVPANNQMRVPIDKQGTRRVFRAFHASVALDQTDDGGV